MEIHNLIHSTPEAEAVAAELDEVISDKPVSVNGDVTASLKRYPALWHTLANRMQVLQGYQCILIFIRSFFYRTSAKHQHLS